MLTNACERTRHFWQRTLLGVRAFSLTSTVRVVYCSHIANTGNAVCCVIHTCWSLVTHTRMGTVPGTVELSVQCMLELVQIRPKSSHVTFCTCTAPVLCSVHVHNTSTFFSICEYQLRSNLRFFSTHSCSGRRAPFIFNTAAVCRIKHSSTEMTYLRRTVWVLYTTVLICTIPIYDT